MVYNKKKIKSDNNKINIPQINCNGFKYNLEIINNHLNNIKV